MEMPDGWKRLDRYLGNALPRMNQIEKYEKIQNFGTQVPIKKGMFEYLRNVRDLMREMALSLPKNSPVLKKFLEWK